MKKVLIAKPFYSKNSPSGYKLLKEKGYDIIETPYNRDYTVEELKKAIREIDGVIADSEKWCDETLDAAPKLKVISRYGTGMDNVDVEAAKRHGVIVTNCPGVNSNTVAEQAVALLLSATRNIPQINKSTKQGGWDRGMFSEISGSTVGILGFGNIGQKVAKKLTGFGCRIIAYDKYPNLEAAKALEVELVTFEQLLSISDCISIHMPLLAETYHCISDENLNKMKKGVIIVNTSRGPIVDENAMYNALKQNQVALFASDVFEQEPPASSNPLFKLENYIATPHIAGETYENSEKTGLMTAQVIVDVFEGRNPANRRV